MAASAMRKPEAGVVPVGFLDDDPDLTGGLVERAPRVFGGLGRWTARSPRPAREVPADHDARRTGQRDPPVVDAALAHGLDVRTVPSMNDLLDGTLDAYRVRRVQVEDLLRRPTATEHAAAVRELIRDKTVVITGAGGSIGSELARQVCRARSPSADPRRSCGERSLPRPARARRRTARRPRQAAR